MFRYKIYIIFIILFSTQLFADYDDYIVENITKDDGLIQSDLQCLCQDSHGFLWFGTKDGLNRYDGITFKVYRHNRNDTNSISDNRINKIVEDSKGNLWFGTLDGLNLFEFKQEKFKKIVLPLEESENKSIQISSLYIENNDDIWIGSFGNGLFYYSAIDGKVKRIFHKTSGSKYIEDNYITDIHKDNDGNMWFGTHFGLIYSLNKNSENLEQHQIDLPEFSVRFIFELNGKLFIGIRNHNIFVYDKIKKNISQIFINGIEGKTHNFSPYCYYIENDSTIWIGTYNTGLFAINPDGNVLHHFQKNNNKSSNITSNTIVQIIKDRSDILWLGTAGGGVSKIRKTKFESYNTNNINLTHDMVWSFCEADSEIWIGTLDGITIQNKSDKSIRKLEYKLNEPNKLSNKAVWSIVKELYSNIFWIGTSNGLNRYDNDTEKFTYYFNNPEDSSSLGYDYVSKLFIDSRNRLWVGTDYGLAKYNRSTDNFTNYQYNQNDQNSLSSNDISDIIEVNEDQIWISTRDNGISILDVKSDNFTFLNKEKGLNNNFIISSYFDGKETFWIGTSDGLNSYNIYSKEIQYFSTNDGLPNNYIYGILEDDENNLWISTNNGISRFNPASKVFTNFSVLDGLQDNEFNINAYFKLENGEMLFGGINGYNRFNPKNFNLKNHRSTLVFTDIKVYNKSVGINEEVNGKVILSKNISTMDRIILSHKEKYFSFEFALLDFTNLGSNRYSYKLEGFDSHWIDIGNKNVASFTNINPGEYILKIRAINNHVDEQNSIKLIILPPWWKTQFFRYFYLFMIIFIVIFSHKYRVRRLNKKHEELQVSKNYIDLIINSMTSGIIGVNKEGKVTHWNDAASLIFEKDFSETNNQNLSEIIPENFLKISQVEECITKNKTDKINKHKRIVNNITVYEDITIFPIKNTDFSGAVIQIDNISDRVNMEELMIQTEKMMSVGGLAAGMAHEINNPLAGIMQNASVVLNRLTKESPKNVDIAKRIGIDLKDIKQFMEERNIIKQLNLIYNSGNRASQLVNNMLSFSRKSESNFVYADLRNLMDSTINLVKNDYNMRKHYDFKKIKIDKIYQENLPKIRCEETKIQQVLMNIIKNGTEAMYEENKTVENPYFIIRIIVDDKVVRMEIENNGPSIPFEMRKRIFEPFFTTKSVGKGTGLGLSVSYFIITENHKGSMWVESEESFGTKFIIELPLEMQEMENS